VGLPQIGVDLMAFKYWIGRFAVFALGKIFFAAVQIFLLAHVRISRATSEQAVRKSKPQQTNGNRTAS